MSRASRFLSAREKMGRESDRWSFAEAAMRWLARQWGDVHVEYHASTGWQVSCCYHAGKWGDDGWLTGDGELKGTLDGALLAAVEQAVPREGGGK